ncbi:MULTISPECIES: hypothetical protein [Eubacteriales]|jgi:hypothetical protein|uniref:hypothetical protein n=1 Tax=Eubacteriales TaxID=186802 RepID=UPI001D07ACFD|nr:MULTISPECIES: hypothetical protein [Eubacteriales]MCB7039834.1 hypothetical protein [Flavonifractor plautii]MCB7049718.1 hypothetical protein [Intestinimonas butyriciproducens]
MKKCDTCANRNTRWCNGCEHNFPGLEQFDFYQETAAAGVEPGSDSQNYINQKTSKA